MVEASEQQILAWLPGFSRSGATIAAGLVRGLDHEDAARFALLLATPVILAAGLLKLPELAGPKAMASTVRSSSATWPSSEVIPRVDDLPIQPSYS